MLTGTADKIVSGASCRTRGKERCTVYISPGSEMFHHPHVHHLIVIHDGEVLAVG
jgi:hypothetical protein